MTAFVRDETKLLSVVDRPIPPNLRVFIGGTSKSADIARVMVGHDVAINAAGRVTERSTFTQLVRAVVDSAIASLGEGGRLSQFGGAAVLDVPCTHMMAVDLPKVPKVYEAHRTNLNVASIHPYTRVNANIRLWYSDGREEITQSKHFFGTDEILARHTGDNSDMLDFDFCHRR